ncbi:MAG TPA: SpoIIE family protein phosphatase [Spirochaetia bacterium]|nr:SpoIIE family protein phosphatase [Spirochaetia bacterium]
MGKARIMVVEDEGVVAMQISETLRGLGYEVPLMAMSGEEAVSRLLDTEPDLVLMDIHLRGGISGIEAAHRIRQRLDVPIVYLTAFSDSETLDQAQLTEPYGYVLKPFEEKSLHAILQMSLMKHRRTRGIRENGWWMSAVAESMMESVLICDPKGYVKFANPAAETLLGRPRKDMVETRLSEIIHLVNAESRTPVAFPVTEPFLEGRSTLQANCRLVLGEDRELPVEFSASPLRSPEGTLFGILYVFRETSERDRIQNVVLRQLEELSIVQKRLQPSRETTIPGLRFEWLFLPTTLGGGDALGCFRLDDEHAAFYAIDVVGQGIIPSLFSLVLHMFLTPQTDAGGILMERNRQSSGFRVLSPAEVVRKLNTRFYLRDDANPYFTMSYATIEPATGRLRLVRAGHPFPILQKADGTLTQLRLEGYAVGLFPSADIASEELELTSGDRLFLYSDGLMDCANPAGLSFGAKRLEEAIRAGRTSPLSELVKNLRQALIAWRGSEVFNDDVSLLAVEKE